MNTSRPSLFRTLPAIGGPTTRPGLRPFAGRIGLLAALLLSACGSTPVVEPPPPQPAPAPAPAPPPEVVEPTPAPPSRPSLMAERSRLAALFRGTPVDFAIQADGSLRVSIPLRYCFDSGRFAVKAPLAAVLDRVALSQAGGNSRIVVSAPADAPPAAAKAGAAAASAAAPSATGSAASSAAAARQRERLASQRVAKMIDHLVAKGIDASRLSAATVVNPTSVRLFVSERPAP